MAPGYRSSAPGGSRSGGARFGGPKLPSALREQVEDALGKPTSRRGQPTRKDQRKFARMEKKQNNLQNYGSSRLRDDPADAEPVQPQKRRGKRKAEETDGLGKDGKMERANASSVTQGKKKKSELRLPQETAGDAEDGEIEWLEYMLKKEKNKASDEDALDDGLDDLLGFADLIGPGGKGLKRNDLQTDDSDQFGDELSDGQSAGLSDSGDFDDSDDGSDEADGSDVEESQDDDGESDAASVDERERNGKTPPHAAMSLPAGPDEVTSAESDKVTEDKERGDRPNRYVPPQVRAAQLAAKAANDTEKSQAHTLLVRRLQGLLNRLSEANIESILGEIEGLYRDHSRNEMTTSLTDLIIQTIADKANLLDSFVILYASLAGALHRIIGIEFGAHLVHSIVLRYEATRDGSIASTTPMPASIYETPDATKESLNLLTLIAELYNAQVISAKLIYDLVLGFINTDTEDEAVLGEREVEGLLRIIKCCGQQLRSDDPASLKDIVNLVQEKTAGKEKTMTTRARFMIETLANLRSGKSKAKVDQGADAIQRMKKFLSGLGKKRRLMTYEPLRVSLSDLLNADKKGKWWLVGAGWSGNPLVEHQESLAKSTKAQTSAGDENAALLEMARKQGMNTDVRRSIFLVLMTCEDFLHAVDRFSQLRFIETQQREIVRVTFHCLSLEKTYNPYYTLVLNELCRESHSHRFTLQYALWDFIRMLDAADGDAKVRSRKADNTAKAMAYMIAHGKMELSVFKAIDFTALTSQTRKFLTTTVTDLLVSSQTASPLFHLPKHLRVEDFDNGAVIDIFEKVLAHEGLTHGLTFILKSLESRTSREIIRDEIISKGISTAMSVLTGRIAF